MQMPMINTKAAPPISDGNSPWNEWLAFSTEEFEALKVTNPELFDPELSPRDRAAKWKAFAYTRAGLARRVR